MIESNYGFYVFLFLVTVLMFIWTVELGRTAIRTGSDTFSW